MAAGVAATGLFGGLNRLIHGRQQHGAVTVDIGLIGLDLVMEIRPQAIQGTAANQRIGGALVDALEVDPCAEIEQVFERPVLARLDNGLHRPLAHALDRAQAVNNPPVVIHGELELGVVHIRRIEAQLHAAALFDQGYDLVGVVHIRRQHRRHKRRRIVSFQPSRLIRHQAIGGGVGFVKAITGELFHQVEDVARQVRIDVVAGATVDKATALLGHLLGLFLTHGAAQHVCLAEGVTGHDLGNLHHLLLIQDDAVSRQQYRLEAVVLIVRVRVRQLGTAVLTVDKVVHHARLQRARTEQCHQSDQVFQAVGLELLDQLLHAP